MFVACTVVVYGWASATSAVSIANRDSVDHKVTVIEGEQRQTRILKPAENVEDMCPKGCIVRLNDNNDSEYVLEPSDKVSIESGKIYLDTPEAPLTPPPSVPPRSP